MIITIIIIIIIITHQPSTITHQSSTINHQPSIINHQLSMLIHVHLYPATTATRATRVALLHARHPAAEVQPLNDLSAPKRRGGI